VHVTQIFITYRLGNRRIGLQGSERNVNIILEIVLNQVWYGIDKNSVKWLAVSVGWRHPRNETL
jgi:hypothetical protein